jgi:hypothetical protein
MYNICKLLGIIEHIFKSCPNEPFPSNLTEDRHLHLFQEKTQTLLNRALKQYLYSRTGERRQSGDEKFTMH